MKKSLLFLSLSTIAVLMNGQFQWGIDFENNWYLNRIVIDTTSNPNCTWQIGHPNKSVMTSAHSNPNAIITDIENSVPPNDTSIFYLYHERDNNNPFHVFGLNFWYQMDGDSTDIGIIEISPDSGVTWINMLTQDTTYDLFWNTPKPTLNGTSEEWKSFNVSMESWASGYETYPVAMTADTIIFRFTYISDSSSTTHDGWMIDDFNIYDIWEGIEEFRNDNLISIYPNPVSDNLRIQRNRISDNDRVQVINCAGQILVDIDNFYGNSINTKDLSNGIYQLRYYNKKNFAVKKFVVQH